MKTIWIAAISCICFSPVLDSIAQDTQETGMTRTERGFVESTTATYTVDPGGELTIDADLGSVRIETSASDTAAGNKVEILVEKHRKEGAEHRARRAFDEVDVTTEQRGNDVHIRVDKKRWGKPDGVSVAIMVRVPESFDVEIDTKGGSIEIEDLDGEIVAKTAGGSIRIGATNGRVTARTLGGSIRIGPTEGGVSAKTLGGSIDIGDTSGDVEARTLGGSIRVGNMEGDLSAFTMGGNITVESASGKVSAKTLGGKVRVGST